jgi:hypothetical protein
MISEFHLLAEKVNRLAELARMLRRENAELRQEAAAASAENAELSRRMEEAHARVVALLDKIPGAPGAEAGREAA